MTRRVRLLLLAGSLFDLVHLPLTASGRVRARNLPGAVPAAREFCEACQGSGWRADRFRRRVPCVECGGRLEVRAGGEVVFEARDGLGWFEVDPMLAGPWRKVGSTTTGVITRPPRTVRCDSCGGDGAYGNGRRCPWCGGEGRRVVAGFVLHVDREGGDDAEAALCAAIDYRRAAGSYRELERGLAALRLSDEGAWRAFVDVAVFGDGESVNGSAGRFEAAVEALLDVMPDVIKVPADVVAAARRRDRVRVPVGRLAGRELAGRDADMRRRYEAGEVSQQELVRESGLSRSRVCEIVNGR